MPKLPQPSQIRSHVLFALARYWPASCVPITTLPLQVIRPQPAISPPLRLQVVAVPHWAADAAVEGKLLVPYESYPPILKQAPTPGAASTGYSLPFSCLRDGMSDYGSTNMGLFIPTALV